LIIIKIFPLTRNMQAGTCVIGGSARLVKIMIPPFVYRMLEMQALIRQAIRKVFPRLLAFKGGLKNAKERT